ncbi:MAG: hypothetical protein U1F22_06130 [Lysobacterales bacterium]
MPVARIAAVALAAACLGAAAPPAAPPVALPAVVGRLGDARLIEVSGIAASRRVPGRWWVHNDSGDGPFLYAIDASGALQGVVQIDGVLALDWEDIASFTRDGKAWLLVADGGDNLGLRPEYELIAIEEPALPDDGSTLHVQAAWQLRYRYPGGVPHDTEAMAVDAAAGNVYLVPKFVEPPTLYRVPLRAGNAVQEAQAVGTLAAPTGASLTQAPKFRPTALDFAADGRHAAVLGYRSAWIYARKAGESWPDALARAPRRVAVSPPLRQPEALGFAADSHSLLLGGEGAGQPLLRVTIDPAH